jgi:hypothetical protein
MNLWAKVLAHARSQKVCGFNTTAVQFGTAVASYNFATSLLNCGFENNDH